MTDYRRLRVALLGAGAVGSQVADLLLRQADQAMYQAKLAGKNCYRFFDPARA